MEKKTVVTATASGTGIIGSILAAIISVEGIYSNDPYDPGQETKYGVTLRVARDYGYKGEMKDFTLEDAYFLYNKLYVQEPNFNLLVELDPAITHKLVDAGVNVGTKRVSTWFQKALNAYSNNGTSYPMISEDGVIGNNTLNAFKRLRTIRGNQQACELIIKALDSYQGSYYLSLKNHGRFMAGWLGKRVQNVPLDQCKEYNLHITPRD